VYNGLRNTDSKPGDLVAVQGIGGLGHLAIQFARKMGYRVAAVSTGADKKELATKLGAHYYIDSSKQNAVEELKKLGGAKVVLTTAFDAKAMSTLVDGLSASGTLLILGADGKSLDINPVQLIMSRIRVQGWPSGRPIDSEETLKFAAENGVASMSEVYPLEKAQQAYENMMANKARFRLVLVPSHAAEAAKSPKKK